MMASGGMRTMVSASRTPSPFGQFLSRDTPTSPLPARSLAKNSSSRQICYNNALRVSFRGLGFNQRSVKFQTDECECSFGDLGCSSSRSSSLYGCSVLTREVSVRAGYAFVKPSVTAEELEDYENQLTEQEAVVEYLQSTEIDTDNLDELDLPPSLEIVRERVEFLQKIGLTVEDINDYPLMIGYSVKRNLIPVLNYLESLGVTQKSLPILVRKYPQVLHSSVVVDLQPTVDYLEGLGIERADMSNVLTRYPEVFGFKIEGTISTSTAYLIMLGVNPRRMGYILTQMPQILGMRVGNNIKRKVNFLQGFGIPQSAIAKMIENRPFFLGLDLADQMRPAVDSLLELGVEKEAVGRVIMQFPDVLGLDVMSKLAERLPWLTTDVEISKTDIGGVVAKLPQILVINVTKGSERVDFLRHVGFSAEDVGSMVTSCPQLLAASVEKSLKPNLDYLVEKMGRKTDEVIEFPAYLLYDLESVILPRYHEITKKEIECSLAWMLNCTDDVFQQRLNVEYAEQKDQEEEPDVPYIVARRARLTDETVAQSSFDKGNDAESTSFVMQEDQEEDSDVPYVITRRVLLKDNAEEDDAESKSFV